MTLRKVKDHPLWVSVSTNMNEIYRSSLATLEINSAAGVLLTLLVLTALERILRTEERGRVLKADQLRLTLENMSQGIMLVTKDLQIPIINSRCGELLDLPVEFVRHPAAASTISCDTRRAAKASRRPTNSARAACCGARCSGSRRPAVDGVRAH